MSGRSIVVVGGNGFLGSAICRTAVARSWTVHSISSSGRPYASPSGHTPKWAHSVTWHAADAFEPASYAPLLAGSSAVVHTLGILLEDDGYKRSVARGDVLNLARAFLGGLTGERGNPLKTKEERRRGYEGMNRDSALAVLDAYINARPSSSSVVPSSVRPPSDADAASASVSRPFVYISAADAFRPLVPAAYLETKRSAELLITRNALANPSAFVRPIFMRPGLMYHPHIRPISTLPAFALSLTAGLADRTGLPNPFASRSGAHGALEALRTHPLHVDHVAEAVMRAIEDEQREGVVDVETMRRWAGFKVSEDGARDEMERRHQEHML